MTRRPSDVLPDGEPRVIGPGFNARVWDMVARVPHGRLTTYGDVATMLGSPRVARQVGWALAALPPDRDDVPWHRVINARGAVSFKGDVVRATLQHQRIQAEGIMPDAHGYYDLKRYRHRWDGASD